MQDKSPKRTTRVAVASIALLSTLAMAMTVSASASLDRTVSHHALTKITLAQPTATLLWAPLYVAEARGLFEKNGLDVNVVVTGGSPTAISAVLAGSAQIAGGGLSDNIAAAAQGKPLITFATIVNKNPDDIVVSKDFAASRHLTTSSPLASKVKALEGATIGITSAGSLPQQFVDWLLPQYGLDPSKDVTFVPLHDPSTAVATMDHGRVDAIVFPPPAPQVSILDGAAEMWVNTAKGEVKPGYQVGLMTSASYLKSHPGIVRAVARAIAQAQQYIFANRHAAGGVIEKFFSDEPPKAYAAAWANQIQALAPRIDVTKSNFADVVSFLQTGGGKMPSNLTYPMVATNVVAQLVDKQLAAQNKKRKK
jgi:NitT/TauT family transport system substrate-binding protein